MGALDQIQRWKVPAAAGAVFEEAGVRESVGDTTRVFELASVSKPIAAFATLIAVEEGIVTLDDPVEGAPQGAQLRHLLAHSSGLSPDDPTDVLATVGARRIYSNAGFELVAEHVAAAAGVPFAEYVHEAIVEPLALSATSVDGSPAHGYRSCVDDLVTIFGAVISGRLLAPETVATMIVAADAAGGVLPGYGTHDPNPWGLGVEVRGEKSPHWTASANSPRTWGHFGRAGTFVWWDPVPAVGLVVLTNRAFGPWAHEAWPALSASVLAAHG